jgi:EAL domain-containing protein (putative c-di-GMP-specific phosphodiesterase class I)
VYVNISGHQVRPEHLVPVLGDALSEHGLESQYLGIELTETAMLANPDASAEVIRNVQRMGVKVAIDDFGTGYSGLSYLQSFAIDSLKIDQSFVRSIQGNPDSGDGRLASAIVALGHSLGLEVVAEGVETQAQLEFFEKTQCDRVQGYLLSHPKPAHEVLPFLEKNGSSKLARSILSRASSKAH